MKSKLFPKTVPGVEELLDMASFFYQLDYPRNATAEGISRAMHTAAEKVVLD